MDDSPANEAARRLAALRAAEEQWSRVPAAGRVAATARRLNGRAAALRQWSEIPLAARPARTQAARDGFLARLEREVDPDGRLDPDERRQLAVQRRRAHMIKIRARRGRKSA